MSQIQFTPEDVLFFGDSRVRDLGEFGYFQSQTLPYPSSFYAAVRGNLWEHFLKKMTWKHFPKVEGEHYRNAHPLLYKILGDQINYGSLQILGPFLFKGGVPFHPVPANIFYDPKTPQIEPLQGKPLEKTNVITSLKKLLPISLPEGMKKVYQPLEGFFSADELEKFLLGGTPRRYSWSSSSCFTYENKVGIHINEQGCAKDKHLFTQEWVRFQDRSKDRFLPQSQKWSIGAWLLCQGSLDFSSLKNFFLGGESRFGNLESCSLYFRKSQEEMLSKIWVNEGIQENYKQVFPEYPIQDNLYQKLNELIDLPLSKVHYEKAKLEDDYARKKVKDFFSFYPHLEDFPIVMRCFLDLLLGIPENEQYRPPYWRYPDSELREEILEKITEKQRFLLYLSTPLDLAEQENITLSLFWRKKANLVAIANRKPLVYSGWEIQKQSPKPIRRLLPAGTVLFFQGKENWKEEDVKKLWSDFMMRPLPVDNGSELSQLGFGITLLGTW